MKNLLIISMNYLLYIVFLLSQTTNIQAQCNPPAALDCDASPVLCSLDELDGYACSNPDITNPTGPSPLCFGQGAPHNTNWWAFVGNGKFIVMVFDLTVNDCMNQQGIQVGIINDCGGDPLDCNANCNTSAITLTGQTINCHTYYVWVDGCNGDVCDYTIAVSDGEPPSLPKPLPIPELVGRACPCGFAEVCVEALEGDCDAKRQWTVDGIDQPDFEDFDCIDLQFSENPSPVEVCVTFTIGNPNNPNAICDQESTCVTIVPESIEKEIDPAVFVCYEDHEGGGYEWRDTIVFSSCIDPPCKIRRQDNDDCCVDYEIEIELANERTVVEVYRFICSKSDLPLITEDGTAWTEEACGEDITWSDPDYNDCDTTYLLYFSFFDPKVTLTQDCGACDGFVTLFSEVEFSPECMNGSISWQGYWLNDNLDTIGSGSEVIVKKEGSYQYVLHAIFVDAVTGEVQNCDVEDAAWVVVVESLEVDDPVIVGTTPICGASIGDYFVDNFYLDACRYNWYIKQGAGSIVTNGYEDSLHIEIQWDAGMQGGGKGEVCLHIDTDCSKSKETCFEVIFKPAPDPDAGPDQVICAKDSKLDGTFDLPGGKWTIIKAPGNITFDTNDIKTDISVDVYGEYVLVWTESELACIGDDTVTVIFNSDPEIGTIDTICGGDAIDYRIIFNITGGTSPYTIIQGGGSIDQNNIYTSDTILDNQNHHIVIQDTFGCFFEFDIDHDCTCPNEKGIVSSDKIEECGVTTVMIDYNPTNQVLGPDDVVEYVLYAQFGNLLGSEIIRNKTGLFTFDPNTMTFGQTYFLGVIIGKNDGNGSVDQLGGCLKIAEGQPVVWYEIPTPDAGLDFSACATNVNLTATQSISGSEIKWINTPGAIIDNPNNISTSVTVTSFGRYVFRFTELNEICAGEDSIVVIFNESPELANLEKTCIDQNVTYEWTYTLNIGKGLGPYLLISGNGTLDVNTGSFSSNRLQSLERDTVIVQDQNGCRDTLFLVHNCDCGLTKSGTMNTQLEELCVDECVTVLTNNDHGLENDDCVYMVLHPDSASVDRGKIIAIQNYNAAGNEFCFDKAKGMIINQIYYVSYIIGECDPSGDIKLSDACFKIISKPIRFLPYPTPDAGNDQDVCGLFTQFTAIPSIGTGTWTLVNNPPGANAIFDMSLPTSNLSVDEYGSYTFNWLEDNGGCSENDNITITFHGSPTWTNVSFECDEIAENYRLTFEINGGDQTSWDAEEASGWKAINIGGNTYQSPWIPTGDGVSISINDVFDCSPSLLDTSFVCDCVTDPGSITINPEKFCVSGEASTSYSGGTQDANDIIIYSLHDGNANNIGGNIILTNSTGKFVFDANTMVLNKVYYVTARIGNNDGNGGVVLSDRCLGQTIGVPVVWYENPEPKIVASEDSLTCQIAVIELDGSSSINKAGTGNHTYIWSTSNGAFETGTDITQPKVNIVAPGTYTLTVVNDLTGCTEVTSFDINISRDLPNSDPGSPQLLTCDVTSVQLDGSNSDNGNGLSVTWSGPGINSGNMNSIQPTVDIPGTYILSIKNSITGCEGVDSVVVRSDYSKPTPDISQSADLSCTNVEIDLIGLGSTSPNGIRSYIWSTTNGIINGSSNGGTITIGSPGTYTLIVTDDLTGCTDTIEFDAVEIDNTLESIEYDELGLNCFGDRNARIDISNIIGGFGPFEYSFNGGSFSNTTQYSNLGPGKYDITVRDINGCEIDTFIIIDEPGPININTKEDQFIAYGDDISLDSLWHNLKGTTENEPGTEIFWLDENGDLVVNPDLTDLKLSHYQYTVVVRNANGCESRDILNIFVKIERNIFVPNVIAPKSDGSLNQNKKLLVFGKPGIVEKINKFEVYDRWGERVYKNDGDILFDDFGNSLDGWNGQLNGDDLNPGVYIYYIEIQFLDLGDGIITKVYYGDVTLIK